MKKKGARTASKMSKLRRNENRTQSQKTRPNFNKFKRNWTKSWLIYQRKGVSMMKSRRRKSDSGKLKRKRKILRI
jgi:hypothetical protein